MNSRFTAQRDFSTIVYRWVDLVLDFVQAGKDIQPMVYAMEFLLGSELEAGGRSQISTIDNRIDKGEITETQGNWLKLGVGMELVKSDRILKRRRLEPDPGADDALRADPFGMEALNDVDEDDA